MPRGGRRHRRCRRRHCPRLDQLPRRGRRQVRLACREARSRGRRVGRQNVRLRPEYRRTGPGRGVYVQSGRAHGAKNVRLQPGHVICRRLHTARLHLLPPWRGEPGAAQASDLADTWRENVRLRPVHRHLAEPRGEGQRPLTLDLPASASSRIQLDVANPNRGAGAHWSMDGHLEVRAGGARRRVVTTSQPVRCRCDEHNIGNPLDPDGKRQNLATSWFRIVRRAAPGLDHRSGISWDPIGLGTRLLSFWDPSP